MELRCPECLGGLESYDGLAARCTVHGGKFKILFARHPIPAPKSIAGNLPPVLSQGAMCAQHATVPAIHACASCGAPLCAVCDFTQPNGGHRCPDCALRATTAPPITDAPPPLTAPLPAGVKCVQHPQLDATGQCKVCGGFMCGTCAFEFPGGIKMCPACATNPRTSLSPKRKKMLIGSFLTAAWCTLLTVTMFAGAFRGMVRDPGGQMAFGMLLLIFMVGPAIAGLSMGIACMDRRLPTTIGMWIATAWNGLALGGYLLMVILGLLSK